MQLENTNKRNKYIDKQSDKEIKRPVQISRDLTVG